MTGGSYGAVGGVVGINGGTVETSYNTGSVSGNNSVGGVVGYNTGTVETSFNTGNVNGGGNTVGGVVGYNCSGKVKYSYNTGNVNGRGSVVGGVVGYNSSGTVETSYNTGSVTGSGYVGGVVGINSGAVETSYNTGSVSGNNSEGGVVGINCGTVENTYYNTSVSYGRGAIGGGTTSGTGISNNNGISPSDFSVTTSATAGVSNLGTFNTWGSGAFNSPATSAPWYEGTVFGFSSTAPMLVSDLLTATVTGNSGTSVYNGSTVSPGYTTTYTLPSGITVTASSAGPNAGTYKVTPTVTGTFAQPTTQTSVDSVSAVSGTWTITPLSVTATANSATMTYGGTVPTLSGIFSTTGPTGGLANLFATWTTPATSASNVGSYAVTPGIYFYSNGAVSGDYTITQAFGNATALTIGKADLTVTANSTTMTYGGKVPTLSGTVTGFVNGQTLAGDGGVVTWTTPATSSSNPGVYAIKGTMMTAFGNVYGEDYTVVQASGNATALTITPAPSTSGSSGSLSTGSPSGGSGTPGGITSTHFAPVAQTAALTLSGSGTSISGNSSDSGGSSSSTSEDSITLSSGSGTSLSVVSTGGGDTTGDGILSSQEVKP
uniref:MBG domain-containing protein n=1 Tax=Leptospirillum ferrodiazotrophum TaxID=412449 RepID=C6HUT4_9BACT|nr:MAG: conserved hypothetical protein [Leptospirillum ferrodiazotrophum]